MEQTRTTPPKAFCFVLMPFDDAFADVYQIGIKEACATVGAYCERVDDQNFRERILDRIYNQIAKADLIIADMTRRNPNVFYEVGYAHALGKPTILITQDADDIPFDLKHFPHIVYGNKIAALREHLADKVRWHMENPVDKVGAGKIDIEIFLGGKDLSSGSVVCEYPDGHFPNAEITIHNASPHTFEPGAFKIGVLTGSRYPACTSKLISSTPLPDGDYLHMLPDFPLLFPQAFAAYKFVLQHHRRNPPPIGQEDQVTLRVFTRMGTRDFPLTMRKTKGKS